MMKIAASILLWLVFLAAPAAAQTPALVKPCVQTSPTTCPPVTATAPLPVTGPTTGGGFPTAATAIQGNGSGTTGAVVGTLAGAASKTTYLCDLDVSAAGTGSIGPVTVAGLLGGSKVFQLPVTAGGAPFSKSFNPCLPASAVNTAITITTTADGTATAVNVNSSGFQQ